MKKIFTLLLLVFTLHINYAQHWEPIGFEALPENYYVQSISPVDENVVWVLGMATAVFNTPTILRTVDGGETFEIIEIPDLSHRELMDIHGVSEDVVFFTVQNGVGNKYIYKSTDGLQTYEVKHSYQASRNFGPVIKFSDAWAGLAVDMPHNKVTLTFDGGDNWQEVDFPTLDSDEFIGLVSPPNWLDVQGTVAWLASSKKIYRSLDGGATWENSPNQFTGNFLVSSIQVNDEGVGLAIGHVNIETNTLLERTQIQRTTDFGDTWTALPDLDFPLTSITPVPGAVNTFVGVTGIYEEFNSNFPHEHGSYITRDAGETWTKFDNQPLTSVVFQSEENGWAGKVSYYDYGGKPTLFKYNSAPPPPSSTKDLLPADDVTLFPNPVLEYLNVQMEGFEIESLELFNSAGQLIERFPSGKNQISIAHLPKGVYQIRVISDSKSVLKSFSKI